MSALLGLFASPGIYRGKIKFLKEAVGDLAHESSPVRNEGIDLKCWDLRSQSSAACVRRRKRIRRARESEIICLNNAFFC